MIDGSDRSYNLAAANLADIPAIAALFTASFIDSVLHYCGRLPKPQAMQDVFALVLEAEPEAAFVARLADGQLLGYCFAPAMLPNLWKKAVLDGHLLKWLWRWLSGQYGFGFYPVKIICLNKLSFLWSAITPTQASNARILSIAVAPAWRGRGVANALMTLADDYFRSRGVKKVRLEVRPDNMPAIKVYRKHGYVDAETTADSQGPWLIMFKEME